MIGSFWILLFGLSPMSFFFTLAATHAADEPSILQGLWDSFLDPGLPCLQRSSVLPAGSTGGWSLRPLVSFWFWNLSSVCSHLFHLLVSFCVLLPWCEHFFHYTPSKFMNRCRLSHFHQDAFYHCLCYQEIVVCAGSRQFSPLKQLCRFTNICSRDEVDQPVPWHYLLSRHYLLDHLFCEDYGLSSIIVIYLPSTRISFNDLL